MARVSIDRATHDLYRTFTEKAATGSPLFPTMKDVFLFNFSVGVRHGVKKAVEQSVDIFQSDVFDKDFDVPILAGVFLSETEDLLGLDCGGGRDRVSGPVLAMAEEYANAGAELTRQAFNPHDPEISLALLLLGGA